MNDRIVSRRSFLKSGVAGAGILACPFISARNVLGANERLDLAGIGVGGKGEADIGFCAGENVVALCDVDEHRAAGAFKRFENAKRYTDFRKLLEKEWQNLDGVVISTPDHTHAWPALMAMKMGKHVYLQKPLTHSVEEARLLTRVAQEHKVITQMGNQGHAEPGSRRLVELVQSGILGEVREVHVWTDRPIWPQGLNRPGPPQTAPAHLDWDLWLGPAPERPYHEGYAPFNWRGFWDFGTGALGDMACHNMDLAFWALGLKDPTRVEARSSGVNEESAPAWSIITYEFPGRAGRSIKLTWYDGGKKPASELAGISALAGNGCLLIGSKDTLYVPMYWGPGLFKSGAKMEDFTGVAQTLPRRPETDNDEAHHAEWLEACKGKTRAQSDFAYAGPMTEAVLLGNIALRVEGPIEWDARAMSVTNNTTADALVRKRYRKGWELPV